MNGWIILDKPSGITSAHAVAKVKRLLKPSKIGHAGTLDPLASGILPLALGEATKTINYMMDAAKSYAFTVTWGEARDTDDIEGKTIKTSPNRPQKAQIEAILGHFLGEIDQMPPQFSALKVDGERAYDLAREGKLADLKPRKITIHSLAMTEYNTDKATFVCECGKGTYIRSIARDMGEKLGCYGHVSMLRRLKVRKFNENHAISLEKLAELGHKDAPDFLLPVDAALDDILALDITTTQATALRHGQAIQAGIVSQETVLAKLDGKPVALCSASHGQLKPVRVFNV